MSDLKYTITKFDNDNKIVTVVFSDGGWAEIRLVNPLPKTIDELEKLIKQFAAPAEAVEARINPDADLSYIDPLVGSERSTSRFNLIPVQTEQVVDTPTLEAVDPEVEANMKLWEEAEFQKKVGAALVKLGVVVPSPAAS